MHQFDQLANKVKGSGKKIYTQINCYGRGLIPNNSQKFHYKQMYNVITQLTRNKEQ